MRVRPPAPEATIAAEKGELLDALLTDQSALRYRVEALAAARRSAGDRGALGVDLPFDDLVELLPEWDAALRPRGHMGDGRSAR